MAIDADDGQVLRLENPELAVATAHPPGSLLKVLATLLALEDPSIDPAARYICRGVAELNGSERSCWDKRGHGPVNLAKALALSCNLYFIDLAARLDPGRFLEFLGQAGLGRPGGVNLPGASAGSLPGEWTREEATLAGAGLSGRVLATPVQVAAWFAALINGGWVPTPWQPPQGPGERRPFSSASALARVRAALGEGSAYGTTRGFAAATGGFAKTGTAGWLDGYHTSAWTAACFEAGGRRIALVVFLTEGQGARDALPLATRIAREMQANPVPRTDLPVVSVSLFSLLAPKAIAVTAVEGWLEVAGGKSYAAGTEFVVRAAAEGGLDVGPRGSAPTSPAETVVLRGSTGPLKLEVAGIAARRVTGEIEVGNREGVLLIINRLPLEDYVTGVATGEIGTQQVALACQAIVARTYAWVNRGRHQEQGFDFCDTTHCQFYSGMPADAPRAAAWQGTSGLILTRAGIPAQVFYHSTCGGSTADAGATFGGESPPHLAGVNDANHCQASPHARWRWQVNAGELTAALRTAFGNEITSWQTGTLDSSGRVLTINLTRDGGDPHSVRAEDWRMAVARRFGWQTLKSTVFVASREGPDWVFRGRGLGHGVGLCQWGAIALARQGRSVEEILAHYFPGTEVATLSSLVPGGQESPAAILERSLLRIAAMLESPASGRPGLWIAPSTSEFTRRSGAPSFAAGRYLRGTIHLQPLEVLRGRGILEQTIAHEAAHFFLEQFSGPGGPLWLIEGLAGILASPSTEDEEFQDEPLPGVNRIDRDLRSPSWETARRAATQATAAVRRLVDAGGGMPELVDALRALRRRNRGPLRELALKAGLAGEF